MRDVSEETSAWDGMILSVRTRIGRAPLQETIQNRRVARIEAERTACYGQLSAGHVTAHTIQTT